MADPNLRNDRTRILLVDDHRIVRQGIRLILEQARGMQVVGEASDAAEAIAKAAELNPNLVIMDIHLATVDGIDTCRRIVSANAATKILMLSSDSRTEVVNRALQSGACGYVLKEEAGEELIRAIEMVLSGRLYLCPEIATALIRSQVTKGGPDAKPMLTERDKDLLRLIGVGLRNKEMAVQLGLSIKSIEATRARLMEKLGCSSPAELVRYAVREGIVQP